MKDLSRTEQPNLTSIFYENRWFFGPYAFVLVLGAVLMLFCTKRDIFLFVNQHYHAFSDYFFIYVTFLGDGLFSLFLVFVLLFVHFGRALMTGLAFLLSGLISVALKNLFAAPRPRAYFEKEPDLLRLIESIDVHSAHSFPSGHTITAFAAFSILALASSQKSWSVVWLVMAMLVAYSRMYLSQHFFEDVYAGSLIGVLSSLIVYWQIRRMELNGKLPWSDRSLLRLRSSPSS
ncbi:Membrane-associated phospholipid phosphatase [Catalinimonas alkaloidigena]|uniref:Membrane-associated phospholipid phosphatase n=1 Tax=Catalinimonas alkaloidigena TaxID=1075417 RepID=A0A1G9LJT8_9BACT|nr:phosphatase PAP2 family protein [Catalinimonas alkaloidigena]SDL62138.1 Membrane-associated phospholipid phosphatase [Catalinimonas alkaloidigena]